MSPLRNYPLLILLGVTYLLLLLIINIELLLSTYLIVALYIIKLIHYSLNNKINLFLSLL
jgi:hypothetical protein